MTMTESTVPYRVVVGLEVHVQLKTQTKLFCRCSTLFGSAPNTQVCPVCLGLPGALPVLNRRAIELAIRAGIALHSEVAPFTKWDRKNYFYPDLPKGYQTSQFDLPICGGGYLEIQSDAVASSGGTTTPSTKRIRLVRAHLEEDAGKSMHDEHSGRADTRIDLNRAGTPLLEIVSEPDISSAAEAKEYLSEMRLLMVYLGISDGNMQEGSLRADANVNLHYPREGGVAATPIVEIKNLNSFRAVERAIQYEVSRQHRQFMIDGKVIGQAPKQTRGWNDDTGETELQREKEESADYRYFPCPDLVPVLIGRDQVDAARADAAFTPEHARDQLIRVHAIKDSDAEILVQHGRSTVEYCLAMINSGAPPRRAIAWMLQDVLRYLNDKSLDANDFPVPANSMAELLVAIEKGQIDTTRGKEVFAKLLDSPTLGVSKAIESLGIVQVDASEIETLCAQLLKDNPDVIEKVKAGNAKAVAALVGQAKKVNRNADPRLVQETCLRLIQQS